MVNECKYRIEKVVEWKFAGMLGVFCSVILRVIEDNASHMSVEKTKEEGKALKEEIVRAVLENEAIASANSSFKDEWVAGTWTIEDYFDLVSK